MSVELQIKFGDKSRSIILDKIMDGFDPRVRKAVHNAGLLIEGQIKRNLSGPSHTRFPGNGNPFPGTLSGRLKNSFTTQSDSSGDIRTVVGTSVVYAARHEFGFEQTPERPYLGPAIDKKAQEAITLIEKATWQL